MIALLAAAALAGSAVSAPTPETTPAPVAEPSAAETLASLRDLYQQSCEVRAYGSYDDMCNGLQRQIEDYGRQAARERRRPRPAIVAPVQSPSATSASGATSGPALANPPG